jgi:hypothetical protein
MYSYHPTFRPCQATSVSLRSVVVLTGCVIPCELALIHFCLLFIFRFSYIFVSEFSSFLFFQALLDMDRFIIKKT